jgi:tetratricopeptide (TPR) repeat protein
MASGHNNLLHVLKDRVEILFQEGKLDEAQRVAQTALDSARRHLGSEENEESLEQLIAALGIAGNIQRHQGEFAAAEALYQEALNLASEHGAPTLQVAQIESSLATLYDFHGLEEDAIPLYEHAIDLYESTDPPLKTESGNLRNNLGMIYKARGDHESAENHYLAALEAFIETYGEQNEMVAAVYNNLGALYYQHGYASESREMHLSALDIRKAIFGERHPDVGQSYSNLALVFYELEDGPAAKEHFEKSLSVLEEFVKDDPGGYEIAAVNYADLLEAEGENKRALSVLKKTQKLLKKYGSGTTTLLR